MQRILYVTQEILEITKLNTTTTHGMIYHSFNVCCVLSSYHWFCDGLFRCIFYCEEKYEAKHHVHIKKDWRLRLQNFTHSTWDYLSQLQCILCFIQLSLILWWIVPMYILLWWEIWSEASCTPRKTEDFKTLHSTWDDLSQLQCILYFIQLSLILWWIVPLYIHSTVIRNAKHKIKS